MSPPASSPATAGEGTDGEAVTETELEGSQGDKTGLYALENADLFNLLCIPPKTPDEDISADLIGKAAKYCKDRRAMFIVDAPVAWSTKTQAVDNFRTSGVGVGGAQLASGGDGTCFWNWLRSK